MTLESKWYAWLLKKYDYSPVAMMRWVESTYNGGANFCCSLLSPDYIPHEKDRRLRQIPGQAIIGTSDPLRDIRFLSHKHKDHFEFILEAKIHPITIIRNSIISSAILFVQTSKQQELVMRFSFEKVYVDEGASVTISMPYLAKFY